MGYLRLTRDERYQIQALVTSGMGIRAIARQLHRPPSTILRELSRAKEGEEYSASKADLKAMKQRHRPRPDLHRIRAELRAEVERKLRLDWSPEQIAGRRQLEGQEKLPFMTIYRFIRRDRQAGGKLWTHLRILRNIRKGRKPASWKPWSFLPDRVNIRERPSLVEQRQRLGDFERDTLLGKRGKSVLLTIVDRTSRKVKLDCLEKNNAEAIHQSTVRLLRNEKLHTITNDNGFEFIYHRKTAEELGAQIFFANKYRSWERGTNENTNGLIRQYFPKKTDIGSLTRKQLKALEERINSRPRKIHGYRTASEVHQALSGGVALEL